MSTETVTIDPADGVGAYVSNCDLANISTAEVGTLKSALGDHGVLFFRDQTLTPEQHLTLAESFGTINVNRFFPAVENHPKIAQVLKEPTASKNIGAHWHTDHSYDQIPAMGSILVSRVTPKRGGDTVFANMFLAYDQLSDGLKKTLTDLQAVHSSRHVFGKSSASDNENMFKNAEAATQDSVHPMVIEHPISGKKALYVNPDFTIGIKGWRCSMHTQPDRNSLTDSNGMKALLLFGTTELPGIVRLMTTRLKLA